MRNVEADQTPLTAAHVSRNPKQKLIQLRRFALLVISITKM
jgi:hypothetical protein